jgi:hypothetical protein
MKVSLSAPANTNGVNLRIGIRNTYAAAIS